MLSQKAKYALHALLYLADRPTSAPTPIAEIAQSQHMPRKFLELILLELKRHGLVRSIRGKHGGYTLAKPPEAITFGQVVRYIDGPLALVPCASKTAYRRCEDCRSEAECPIRDTMCKARDSASRILDSATLAEAIRRPQYRIDIGAGI
ncbi:MAG TPA: Rrf2 family transcriptional regulator [Dongiaceae bacterium]|nr:Rrf2 family transcriptional regulator [Dongiaceae bacterium]